MFKNVIGLHEALLDKDPKAFVSHFIFEPTPYIFGNDMASWIEWKTILADLIDVDPKDIVLTGSAALGYSLNPKKNFKVFDSRSDVDCGIISSHYFDLSWRYLRNLRPFWLQLPSESKSAINEHRKRHIFSGTIAADTILELLPFGKDWQAALDLLSQRAPTNDREIKLRIYKDYDSLRFYQSLNIGKLRDIISESSADADQNAEVTNIDVES